MTEVQRDDWLAMRDSLAKERNLEGSGKIAVNQKAKLALWNTLSAEEQKKYEILADEWTEKTPAEYQKWCAQVWVRVVPVH